MREDLEPDSAAAIEGSCGLTAGDLGHVELKRAGVGDTGGATDGEANSATCGNGGSCCRGTAGVLVAADGTAGDVRHGTVGLVVRSLADILPLACHGTVRDERGENVCSRLVSGAKPYSVSRNIQ